MSPDRDGPLPAAVYDDFAAWIEGAVERARPLGLRDVRRGLQSVSTVYVERRGEGRLGARAAAGPARRAALASFYAPLHFATVSGVLGELAPGGATAGVRRVVDLGCGTGACGAAAARAGPGAPPPVLGLDRSGWALAEARHTWRAFGLAGRARRATLPRGTPRLGRDDLVVLGWTLNELAESTREALLAELARAARAGTRVLVIEPLARRVSPWWDAAAARLADAGVAATEHRLAWERPAWIEALDRASGLDHRELGARVLAGPGLG